jgi:hypothetical protein
MSTTKWATISAAVSRIPLAPISLDGDDDDFDEIEMDESAEVFDIDEAMKIEPEDDDL